MDILPDIIDIVGEVFSRPPTSSRPANLNTDGNGNCNFNSPLPLPLVLPQINYDPASPFVQAYSPALQDLGISAEHFTAFVDCVSRAVVPVPELQVVRDACEVASIVVPGIGDIVAGSIGAAARIGSAAGAQGKVKKILKRANNDTFGPVGLLAVILSTSNLHKLLNYTGPGSAAYKPQRKAEDAARKAAWKQSRTRLEAEVRASKVATRHQREADKRARRRREEEQKEHARREKKEQEAVERVRKREREAELRLMSSDQRRAAEKADRAARNDRDRAEKAQGQWGRKERRDRFWDWSSSSDSDDDSSPWDSNLPYLPYGTERVAPFAHLIAPLTLYETDYTPTWTRRRTDSIARYAAECREEDRRDDEKEAAKKVAKGEWAALDRLAAESLWLVIVPAQP